MNRELLIADQQVSTPALALFLSLAPRTIALSGGSTPRALYERLAAVDYPWAETEIFFGDERCVPLEHPDSNFRMVNEALLSKVPARVHPMGGWQCDAPGYEAELAKVFGPGRPVFDLIFLGLGADGHTASLFPGDAALEEQDHNVVRVERPDHPRLTLTLPVLSAAKVAIFLVAGVEKRDMLTRLLAGGDIPATRVAAERVIVVADRAAAGDR